MSESYSGEDQQRSCDLELAPITPEQQSQFKELVGELLPPAEPEVINIPPTLAASTGKQHIVVVVSEAKFRLEGGTDVYCRMQDDSVHVAVHSATDTSDPNLALHFDEQYMLNGTSSEYLINFCIFDKRDNEPVLEPEPQVSVDEAVANDQALGLHTFTYERFAKVMGLLHQCGPDNQIQ